LVSGRAVSVGGAEAASAVAVFWVFAASIARLIVGAAVASTAVVAAGAFVALVIVLAP
jgi:hypothetical protein